MDLLERLARAGAIPSGVESSPTPPPLEPERVAQRASGARVRRGGHGTLVAREQVLETGDLSPRRRVGPPLARLAGAPAAAEVALTDLVFLDLETTGLGHGAGTYPFLAGLIRWQGEAFVLEQALAPSPADEYALLEWIAAGATGAKALVTYNGKRFDLPLLRVRNDLYGVRGPLDPLPHLDLLSPARRFFAPRIGSCSLGRVQAEALGAPRPEADLPGREVPVVYATWLQTGDPGELTRVVEHNVHDLAGLMSLLHHLLWRVEAPPEEVLASSETVAADGLGLGRAHAAAGDAVAARRAWELAFAAAPGDSAGPDSNPAACWRQAGRLLGRTLKRADEVAAAMTVWEALCSDPEAGPEPWVERAKALEHRIHDIPAALGVVDAALGRDPEVARPVMDLVDRAELEHRRDRLLRKRGQGPAGLPDGPEG